MNFANHDYLRASTQLLNVAIIPPHNVIAAAVELSSEARSIGGSFQIDNISRFAHLTLYMARIERSQLTAVRGAVQELATSLQQHVIKHTGYFVTPGSYYEISYARTPELLAVHTAITESVAPFRFSPGDPVVETYFGKYSHSQALNAKEWGYDLAGELYRPHITLTHFPEQLRRDELPTSRADLSFTATQIGLFEADHMGAARKLTATIDLLDV